MFGLKRYLPGVAAPPTGLRGDAQTLAAGLVGHEGELPHGAASEAVEGAGQGDARRERPGDQEQEEGAVHSGGKVTLIIQELNIRIENKVLKKKSRLYF